MSQSLGQVYSSTSSRPFLNFSEIPNFLTPEECEHIIASAGIHGLQSSSLFFDKFALASKNYTKGKGHHQIGVIFYSFVLLHVSFRMEMDAIEVCLLENSLLSSRVLKETTSERKEI